MHIRNQGQISELDCISILHFCLAKLSQVLVNRGKTLVAVNIWLNYVFMKNSSWPQTKYVFRRIQGKTCWITFTGNSLSRPYSGVKFKSMDNDSLNYFFPPEF